MAKSPGRGFPRSARLIRPAEFRRVFQDPVRSADSALTVLARKRNGSGMEPRLGLAISKKCAKQAIARNRIKRLVRESFRHARGQLDALDCVVMCRPKAARMSNQELRNALERHWQRLQTLCARS